MFDEDDYEPNFKEQFPDCEYPEQEDDEMDSDYENRCYEAEREYLYNLRNQCERGCRSGCNWCLML